MSLNLPRHTWRTVALGEVVENINEYYRAEEDGTLPYVAGPHIESGQARVATYGSTDDGEFPPTFKRMFKPDDVLLHSRGIEKIAVVDRAGVTGEKLFVLRSKDKSVLSQSFLVWLLRSPAARSHMEENFTGSVNKFLNWTPLASMPLNLPPLEEQDRIARLMWSVDSHSSDTRSMSSSLASLADKKFFDELTRSNTSRVPLPELVDGMTVGVVVKPRQYYTDDPAGVPALRGLNIQPGRFVLDELVRFRPESAKELEKSTLRIGDVVVVRTGRPGDAAVVTEEVDGFNCIDLIIVRPGADLVPEFLELYLNSSYGRAQAKRLSAGTAQQHFNVGALKQLTIPKLIVDEQRRLTTEVESIRDSARKVHQELKALEVLNASLLAEIFGAAT